VHRCSTAVLIATTTGAALTNLQNENIRGTKSEFSMSAIEKARAHLAAALERKWDDTSRLVAEGKGGWQMKAAVNVLADHISAYEDLLSRYQTLVANQAASRSRLQKMLLTEAEEVERLRSLLAERSNAA
jgi:hypothetical protein